MSSPALAFVGLSEGVEAALARVPPRPGVGQILGPEEKNLLLGMAANLRRWAASHLGLGPRPAAGKRPRTNLAGVATAVGFVETRGSFHQRLAYERLMAPLVPLSARRDLKPPVFLHLDPGERFPRLRLAGEAEDPSRLFGAFRDRRAAEKARDAVHRRFPLRPCDFQFEPDPALALGLGCLFAQVRSCAAPCLARIGEDEYRALAREAAAWLGEPRGRDDPAVPACVAAGSSRALVIDPARSEVGLFPVLGGRVLDAAARFTPPDALERELAGLHWPAAEGPSDWPWLTAWVRTPKGRASCLDWEEDAAALAARVRERLAQRVARRRGGKVEATRGRD